MIKIFFLFYSIGFVSAQGFTPPNESQSERAKKLKELITIEKKDFDARESRKKDVLDELDSLNADQNQVRQRISQMHSNTQELNMALDNLSLEVQNQAKIENLEKQQLIVLLKLAYKIQRDGVFKFVIQGKNLAQLTSRARVLYRTLRAQTSITKQLQERADRLKSGEKKLQQAKDDLKSLLVELTEQEQVLSELLARKKILLTHLNDKQHNFQSLVSEYNKISTHMSSLFNKHSTEQETSKSKKIKGDLLFPLDAGKIVKNFGKTVHEKFGTVIYQKGIEIESEIEAKVRAVLAGTVEYQGWVKGLGNVIIIRHPGNYYSLNAHLYKPLKDIGQTVDKGEVIGLVGDTGDNEKPSLYFEFREKGKAVDPLSYFSKRPSGKKPQPLG
jgi:septal ring factor EnvC (AmiA/AmiB activator)